MHPMAHIPMQDKDMLCDSLASQKEITGIYNTFSNECVSTPLRNELLNILHDEHSIGADILSEMQNADGIRPSRPKNRRSRVRDKNLPAQTPRTDNRLLCARPPAAGISFREQEAFLFHIRQIS